MDPSTMPPMGWWKPFFFTDVTGVQVLFAGARIEGPASFAVVILCIALLCGFDRWAAARAAALYDSREKELSAVGWWAAQRLSGGLVMLLMMTFNAVLFLATIGCLALAELAVRKTCRSPVPHHFAAVPTVDSPGLFDNF